MGLRLPAVWSRHLGATGSPGTWRWGSESPAPAPATLGARAAEIAFARGAARGCAWGRCPSARVSERVGIPALPLAEDFPVHPAGAGFRFPQRKLFPAFGHRESPADSSPGYRGVGGARRNPWWVRSFLILFAFHVGRVKGQTGALGGWRVRGRWGVTSWPYPEDKLRPPPFPPRAPDLAFVKV